MREFPHYIQYTIKVLMHPIYGIVCSLFLIANFVPGHLTLTVNKGETVHLSMLLLGSEKRDVTWKYNGRFSEDRGKYLSKQGFQAFFKSLSTKPLMFSYVWCRKLLLHDSLERNG